MTKAVEVPREIVARLQLTCLDLPEAYEEPAWVGTRWLVRKKVFAHVLMINRGWPPAYAKAAKINGSINGSTGGSTDGSTDAPVCVVTFRLLPPALKDSRFERPPFSCPCGFPTSPGRSSTHARTGMNFRVC